MLMIIPGILSAADLTRYRSVLDGQTWIDGRASSGKLSSRVKNNSQLPEESPAAIELGKTLLGELGRNPHFLATALPRRIFPPLFNRHERGQSYGWHFDTAVRRSSESEYTLRADLSATLFLNSPEEYEGGELIIDGVTESAGIRLPAGSLVLYPAGALHQVRPVINGVRLAAVLWIQSLVRGSQDLEILYNLDASIRLIGKELPESKALLPLTGVYHNLLRRWVEC